MKKKLLFVIWSNSYGGGAESQMTNLVNYLDKDKYEIDVLEYLHTNIKIEKLDDNINKLKPIIDLTKDSKLKVKIIEKLVYKYPWILRKLYIRKKYDLQIAYNYLIPTFLLDPKVKSISWIHGKIFDIAKEKEPWLNKLQFKSFKAVNKIVAIAKDTEDSILSIYPEFKDKLTVIHNGYVYQAMEDLAKVKVDIKKDKRFKILYCNRFDDNKNPLLLIEAAKLLKEKTDKFHINFLGDGILGDEMKKRIKKYNLQDNITIVGFVKNPFPYIKDTDIICLTSKSEGFSTTLIEGLRFNKPYISTSNGVSKEIVNEEVGLVANTKEEISNSIYELIKNNELYSKLKNNCKEVVERFSIENQVKKAEKLFDEILNEE